MGMSGATRVPFQAPDRNPSYIREIQLPTQLTLATGGTRQLTFRTGERYKEGATTANRDSHAARVLLTQDAPGDPRAVVLRKPVPRGSAGIKALVQLAPLLP